MKTALAIVGALLAAAVQAQETSFPQKAPIEITVLFPAGTSADVTARLLADGMSKQLGGAKVLVVNRPGAGGAIGYKYVASQKPDGYSIVWNSNSISTTFHSGMLPFDYLSPRSRCSRPPASRRWMCLSARRRGCRACSGDKWTQCCSFPRRSRAT